jgi:tRNA (guanine37-N1)-methyltransferase
MHFSIITIFPEFFESPLSVGLLSRAMRDGRLTVEAIQLRDFTTDKHRSVDDSPYGGGPGMLLKPEPLAKAIQSAKKAHPGSRVIALSPGGNSLTDAKCRELALEQGLILVCGRYEGIDQRILDHYCDEEISVGDFVLTGGEPAALSLIDAVARQLPGVVGDPESVKRDSFSCALAHPQYTRPRKFEGREVPEALVSGDHSRIEKWRNDAALKRTRTMRPDLIGPAAAKNLWLILLAPRRKERSDEAVQALHDWPEMIRIAKAFGLGGTLFLSGDTELRRAARTIAASDGDDTIAVRRGHSDAVKFISRISGATPMTILVGPDENVEPISAAGLQDRLAEKDQPAALVFGGRSAGLACDRRLDLSAPGVDASNLTSASTAVLILERLLR